VAEGVGEWEIEGDAEGAGKSVDAFQIDKAINPSRRMKAQLLNALFMS
jgi:hypothetical protein